MSPECIRVIENSWSKLSGKESDLVDLFYTKLLNDNPAYRVLFTSEPKEQRRKFLEMLSTIVNSLRYMDKLHPLIKGLAYTHQDYGVQPDDYDVVSETLIYSLSQVCENGLSRQEQEAWKTALFELKTQMLDI